MREGPSRAADLVTVTEHETVYLIPLGGQPVRLNRTASVIWTLMFEEAQPKLVAISRYMSQYNCSHDQAVNDFEGQLKFWATIGAITAERRDDVDPGLGCGSAGQSDKAEKPSRTDQSA